jgi:hypothetical protein
MEAEIRSAIAAGAPMFNAGRAADCARVYAETATALERKYSVPVAIKAQFAMANKEADASRRAWAFRNGFDSLLGGAPPRPERSRSSAPSGKVSSSVASEIENAFRVGVPAFNGGDARKCAEVYEACARKIMRDVPTEAARTLGEAAEASKRAASAEDRAWVWRRALDAVLASPSGERTRSRSTAVPAAAGSSRILVDRNSAADVVNDTVMGGVSRSSWARGSFYGNVTRERNGGFCSIRFPLRPGALQGAQALELRWEGDGRTYKIQVSDGDGVQWQRDLAPGTRRVELRDLVPSFRGMPMRGAAFDPAGARSVGLMLSFLRDDGSKSSSFRDGGFEVRIDEIRAV